MTISVLMSVYKNEKPEYLKQALESISIEQTHKPDQIVIVEDGPLPDFLEEIVQSSKYKENVILHSRLLSCRKMED